jgi:hypothetical protein
MSGADLLTKARSAITVKDQGVIEQIKEELVGRVSQLEEALAAPNVATEVRLFCEDCMNICPAGLI